MNLLITTNFSLHTLPLRWTYLIEIFCKWVQSLIDLDKTPGIKLLCECSDAICSVNHVDYFYHCRGHSAKRVFRSIRPEKKDRRSR